MISQIETWILGTLQALYDAWGWLGVGAMLVFENATGITPSEIILGLAGWMLIAEHDLAPSMILLGGLYAAIASVIGSSLIYWIARLGGRPVVDKFARWFRIDSAHINQAESLFQRWGPGLVLIGRVIPGIRTLINIPAGLARMPFFTFFMATLIGAYTWCTLLIGAGYLLGHEWALISEYIKQYLPYLFTGGVLLLILYIWIKRTSFSLSRVTVSSED